MASKARGSHSPLTDPRIILLLIVAAIWLCGAVAAKVATNADNALAWPFEVITGETNWTIVATLITVVMLALIITLIILVARLTRDELKDYKTAAASMTPAKRLHHVTEKDSLATGKKLTPTLAASRAINGIGLGRTLLGNKPLFLDWESTMLVVAGPRMGKTTAVALPAIITAPGAVLTTSNKPDIYIDTREYRETIGTLRCFDPQEVAGDTTNLWWDTLRRVHDMPTALKLTGWLSSGAGNSADSNQSNKYFQDEGERLLAILILAAAVGRGDLKHVYDWLKDIDSAIPIQLLREAGFENPASDLQSIQSMETRQRDGVIGFARQPVSLLSHDGFAQYVTPDYRVRFGTDDTGVVTRETVPGIHEKPLEALDTSTFSSSKDTLYALSLEGIGSAAGLVTALTGEILEEATKAAGRNARGRLDTPLVAVLDEAANICKMAELPKQYSHFGSRGIIPITILQSPAQARGVWGADGWEALKSSSAVRFYGGNVDDDSYLGELSNKVGEHEVSYSSSSTGSSGASYSRSVQREKIMDVSDLAALPKELALIQSPGNKPVLVRKDFIFNNKVLQQQITDAIDNGGKTNTTTASSIMASSTTSEGV